MGTKIDGRRLVDHEVYRDLKQIRSEHDWADKYCQWYENGGNWGDMRPFFSKAHKYIHKALELGYSQYEISKITGVSQGSISKIAIWCWKSVGEEICEEICISLESVINSLHEKERHNPDQTLN